MANNDLSAGGKVNAAPALFIIGGAADSVLADFAALAGGAHGQVVIVPHASGAPRQAANRTSAQLKAVGLVNILVCMPGTALRTGPETTAIFMTGGDQSRLFRRLSSEDKQAITAFHQAGGLIAGTSAGAAVMSAIMIAGGMDTKNNTESESSASPLLLQNGLGLCGKIIIDTHFSQRERFQRPVAALATHPQHSAIGIDEDTAILVKNDGIEVFGQGHAIFYKSTRRPGSFSVQSFALTRGSRVALPF